MAIGIWILGDQLWLEQAALQSCHDRAASTPVLLIESQQLAQSRPYHQQKLVLVWSAMRHFAELLQQTGWQVDYVEAETFEQPLREWIQAKEISELRVMQPNDRPFLTLIQSLDLPCQITLVPNNHFLWSDNEFCQWASPRKRLLMEDFYREGRRRFQVLMTGDQPIGGRWNFDQENRKPPAKGGKSAFQPPAPPWFEPNIITQKVIQKVRSLPFATYGQLEPFGWAVTRQQALAVLKGFIEQRLETFGSYQDAMVTGETTMWHALLSPYLNLGLLQPLEVIAAVEQAYHDRDLPLNSVEGFIRQILGWREYMRGLYTYLDADYGDRNWFNHNQPLPAFYWDASQTDMNCLHQCLKQTEQTGYAHHIQRLMILSNFALIAGISPQAIEHWFHAAFIDAYDWVMQTNVIGMGQFADGGILASKPYAASANYVNKMSDYCRHCAYDPRLKIGDRACPFNFFYWDFLARHQEKLRSQGRITMILSHLKRMSSEELAAIQHNAAAWHFKNS